ncbi:MAG TPA: heme ABC transporter ATP-binding protein [Acidimicrobiia bacterium]|jgi:iron complex transport system ATP-binding protein
MTAVVVDTVEVRIGEAVLLDGVSVTVSPGEVVAIVGPNGAGKSTLLSVMAGDSTPTAGRVEIDGDDVSGMTVDQLSRLRSMLSQDLPARIPLRIGELVELGRHPHRRDPGNSDLRDREAVRQAISAVELSGWEDRIVSTLSGGERLRAHLARVIAQDAPVVLLDEPTSALDVAHQEHVLRLCESLARSGRSVALVQHDLNAAARYADRVIVVDRGTIRADGPPAQVLTGDLLSDVYRQPMLVIDHPHRDCPLVLVVDR